jgi:hypothetical protein
LARPWLRRWLERSRQSRRRTLAFNGLRGVNPDAIKLGKCGATKQTEAAKRMNLHTRQTGNDLSTPVEDAHALMASTANMAGKKVEKARKRLATALESAKKIIGWCGVNAVEIPAISEDGRLGTDQTTSRHQNLGNLSGGRPFVMRCNWSGQSAWSFGRRPDESAFMKSQLG